MLLGRGNKPAKSVRVSGCIGKEAARVWRKLMGSNSCTVSLPDAVMLGRAYNGGGHFSQQVYRVTCCLQCFDTVGWAVGRASGL